LHRRLEPGLVDYEQELALFDIVTFLDGQLGYPSGREATWRP
jgi:hypothetical protein